MGIKCPKCHFENPDDTLYCGKCATPLPSSEEVTFPMTKTLETPLEELARGTTFAKRYELIEELGRGGMGRVYKVFDKKIKEEVAIKILKPEIASDETTIERFSNELKLARKIVHKNVGRMYELMEEEGTHFITMEYVAGEDLKTFIRRVGQLPTEKSVFVAKQVCEGLVEAHKLGVIHRDLKPGNIMIDKDGDARVMDFGIARSLKAEGITTKGVVVGTPDYMSPEQVEGNEADQCSDVYSLGVILYEMLTGRVPFEGDTSLSIALKHKTEIPKDPRELNSQIPEYLSRLILKCMEKKREDRYQSVNEIIQELEPIKIEEEEKDVEKRGKLLKLLFTPIKLKKRVIPIKLKRGIRKSLKYSIRALIILFIVYGIISIIGLINDYVYSLKLDKIKVERDTYYKNLFPIQKNWLPETWKTQNKNAYDIYYKLFLTKFDEEGSGLPEEEIKKREGPIMQNPPSEALEKIFKNYEYSSLQELKDFVQKYEKFYKFDELLDAVKCTKLYPRLMLEKDLLLNTLIILRYTKMIILKARIDFLEGNYERGFMKIHYAMVFFLDLSASSFTAIENLIVAAGLRWLYWELVPVFLSREIKYSQNYVKYIERLISATLEKFEAESTMYKEYLWVGVIREYYEIEDLFDMNELQYYSVGKLFFWKNGFSLNRDIYTAEKFYKGMFEGLRYIRNIRDKSVFIKDYCEKNAPEDHYLIPNWRTGPFKVNLTRTFGKLALILSTIDKYGIGSPEFLKIQGTDVFINELSGKKFEIVDEDGGKFVVLDKDYKISLRNIDYKNQYKDILKSFKHFDIKSMKQIRSIFYSYELE